MVRAKIGGQGRAWDDQQVTAVYPSLTIRKNFKKIYLTSYLDPSMASGKILLKFFLIVKLG
jgi:hypothetical protein